MYEVKEHLPIPTKLRKSITVDVNFIRLIGENDFPDGRIFDKIDVLHFCVLPCVLCLYYTSQLCVHGSGL